MACHWPHSCAPGEGCSRCCEHKYVIRCHNTSIESIDEFEIQFPSLQPANYSLDTGELDLVVFGLNTYNQATTAFAYFRAEADFHPSSGTSTRFISSLISKKERYSQHQSRIWRQLPSCGLPVPSASSSTRISTATRASSRSPCAFFSRPLSPLYFGFLRLLGTRRIRSLAGTTSPPISTYVSSRFLSTPLNFLSLMLARSGR